MDRDWLTWVIIGGLLIAATGTGIYAMTRGIRNNNPGNIRHGSSQWLGMSPTQTDTEFVQFDDPVYGIRALAKLLKNYQSRYRLNTVRALISRWAPPNENDTDSYVKHVARVAGVHPDSVISVTDYIRPITEAIIKHENNGLLPYSEDQITKALSLA